MIQHVSFIIADIDVSKYFYLNILQLEEDLSRPDLDFDGFWVKINAEQLIHLLLVDNPDPIKRPNRGGRDRHIAFKVSHLSDIKQRLKEYNVSYTESSSGRSALFCRDPDGNTLELME